MADYNLRSFETREPRGRGPSLLFHPAQSLTRATLNDFLNISAECSSFMGSPASADTRGRLIPLTVSIYRSIKDVCMGKTILREKIAHSRKFFKSLLIQRTISILIRSFSYVFLETDRF